MAKQQKPAWVYLIAGLIIGLFVAFLVFLSQQDSREIDIKAAIENSAQRNKDTREVRQNPNSSPSKPEFDFYKMLPELQVNVSPNLDVNIGSKPKSAAPKAVDTHLYYLQVGAFSKKEGAEKQKVELILKNWPTRIKQGGDNIYRIWVGPYSKGNELSRAEKGLRRQGLKPVRQQTKS
jgi:cell division protein FtsN